MRIKLIGFCRFYYRIDCHTGICPGWGIAEKPVLTTNYQWADAILAELPVRCGPGIIVIEVFVMA
jgi:transposase InsO family protein